MAFSANTACFAGRLVGTASAHQRGLGGGVNGRDGIASQTKAYQTSPGRPRARVFEPHTAKYDDDEKPGLGRASLNMTR